MQVIRDLAETIGGHILAGVVGEKDADAPLAQRKAFHARRLVARAYKC